MAFKKLLARTENAFLAEFPEAYINIERINSNDGSIQAEMAYYADQNAYELSKEAQEKMSPGMIHASGSVIVRKSFNIAMKDIDLVDFDKTDMKVTDILKKACYVELKKLPEFENSTDC